jgi:glycerol-3-phosphate dehydrogenase subunit B
MTGLVVVGGGLGGCVAALAAIRDRPEASVDLLAPNPERFLDEPGLVDVLGYSPDGEGPISKPFYEIRGLPDGHPYRRFGTRTLQNALSVFDEELGGESGTDDRTAAWSGDSLAQGSTDGTEKPCRYRRGGTEANALVGTCTGGIRPVSRYPESVASGLISDERPMRIVGFEQETHLDAALAAERLDDRVRYDVAATTVEFPYNALEYPPALEFARALDENRETAEGVPVREALVEEIRPHLDVEPRIGFPAVLGVENSQAVRRDLESLLQAEVFEIPIGHPSIPGIRLREGLYDRLREHGVTIHRETRVAGFESGNGRIRAVQTADDRTFDATEFVLATGGLDAGGLVATRTDVREPLFDCHLPHPERRAEWSTDEFLGNHPFAEFGVTVTDDLHPRGSAGEPVFGNLRAAGTVIGGWDFTAEHSRAGIALLTGYEAGKLAVEALS